MKAQKIATSLFLCFCFALNISARDLFRPDYSVALRAPAAPLITSDPYLSIWSPYDKLYEGATQHWTGKAHPLIGAVRVDGKTYRFMGKESLQLASVIVPDASQQGDNWSAPYTFLEPKGDWTALNYDASAWKTGVAPFGTRDIQGVKTHWQTSDIYVRRTFNVEEDLSKATVILQYSHDDVFELYLNGERLVKTDYSWNDDVQLVLSEQQKKKLVKGKNVIAAHCHNTTGGGYVDFDLKKKIGQAGFDAEALQTNVDVLPTSTYYSFTCGKIALDIVFTAPMLPDDLDLLSTPVNYISYRVHSLDNKEHEVQVYFETTSELAVNDVSQNVKAERIDKNGLIYLKTGTVNQPITDRIGDDVRIDWGYAYLVADNADNKTLSIGNYYAVKEQFIKTGTVGDNLSDGDNRPITLSFADNLGKVGKAEKTGYLMLGYDDVYSIEYFYKRRTAYWKHEGKVDIYKAFEKAKRDYVSVMERCRDFDARLMTDAQNAGGVEYAELCALAYRQAIAAHKLIQDDAGNLLFLSKENNSNGCINTVDVTYPSAPLFLVYNPDLLKGMLTPIFYYSESGRWTKPFPAHDLGTYPIANGQRYGGDMPVEEAGNMIALTAAIAVVEGNAEYAKKHWDVLTIWTNYLMEHGLDPENQLCTDDFAGHFAHNINLSVKAIMGIASYGKMAEMLGKRDVAQKYTAKAREMAKEWVKMASDGDHYRLTFDKPGTWSQKYNLVWDKMLQMNIFPKEVAKTEIPYYLKRQAEHPYGLPLDSREAYTKSDWIVWTACLADDDDTFRQFISPIYRYANETSTRVPLSDWHNTDTGKQTGFKARSVVGGYYMKVLEGKLGIKN